MNSRRLGGLILAGVLVLALIPIAVNLHDVVWWIHHERSYDEFVWNEIFPVPEELHGLQLYGYCHHQRWGGSFGAEGPSCYWYADSGVVGTYCESRGADGVVSFFDVEGDLVAQWKGGLVITRGPPWLEIVDPARLPIAPWIERGISASEWWDNMKTE